MTRPTLLVVWLAWMALLLPSPAWAQTRICAYEIADWTSDLDAIEAAMSQADLKEAGILIEVMDRDYECLSEPAPPEQLHRYARMRAFHAFHSQDQEGSVRWNRAAEFVLPNQPWPEWVFEGHPLREQLEYEDPTEIRTRDDGWALPPKKGGVFVNGRFTLQLTGPAEVPVFVQVFDKAGTRLVGGWRDSLFLPPQYTTDDRAAAQKAAPPKWWVPGTVAAAALARAGLPSPAPDEAAVASVQPEPVTLPPPEPEPEPEPEPVAVVPEPEPPPAEPLPEVTRAADLSTAEAPSRSDLDCPAEPVTVDTIAASAAQATEAFAATDRERFEATYAALKVNIGCLTEIMDPTSSAVVHRLYAYRAFVDGNDPAALRSFQVGLALDPDYALPEAIAPRGGPLHELYERGRVSPEVSRVGFGEPAGMSARVDGSASARRPISAPAFIQLQTAAGDVHWSSYLTPADPLPAWLPSIKEALLASVGEQVVDEFKELRLGQEARTQALDEARSAVLSEAQAAFTTAAEQARLGGEDGRAALDAYVAAYDDASVEIDGEGLPVVVPQVAAARAWLQVYGQADAEQAVATHARRVETARTEVRSTATGEWKQAERLITDADYGSGQAVTAFFDRYERATVDVGEATEKVFVPEVDIARDWTEIYTLATDKLPDTSDSLKVVLEMAEERKDRDVRRTERISSETSALLGRAREDWDTASAVAAESMEAGRVAVERFVARYDDAALDVEGERIPVTVPEIALARAWLAGPSPTVEGLPVEPMPPVARERRPKRARLMGTAVGLGTVAAATYGASWVSRAVYNNSPNDSMYYVTNATYFTSVAIGITAGGFLIGALATDGSTP